MGWNVRHVEIYSTRNHGGFGSMLPLEIFVIMLT